MDQTAITYPYVTVNELTGEAIKSVFEDVCDNLFNPDPYYQQGGDMVRVGGMSYRCDPAQKIGARISDMTLKGRPIEGRQDLQGSGWAPVAEGRRRRAGVGRRRRLPALYEESGCGASSPTARRSSVSRVTPASPPPADGRSNIGAVPPDLILRWAQRFSKSARYLAALPSAPALRKQRQAQIAAFPDIRETRRSRPPAASDSRAANTTCCCRGRDRARCALHRAPRGSVSR